MKTRKSRSAANNSSTGISLWRSIMNCLYHKPRTITIRIVLLDDSEIRHDIKDDLLGQAILDLVFLQLSITETEYFGCRYVDNNNQTHWLDASLRISRQLRDLDEDVHNLYFGVKFYAADPSKLHEEITRYQLYLQVKQDVLQGRLPVSFELASELGAYAVQSEFGDYDAQCNNFRSYVSQLRIVPNQTEELEQRISEIHRHMKGISPTSAELKYLDKVKWHDLYGVDLHPVLGEDSVEYFLGLAPSGVIVLRNKTTVAHYYWPRIGKVFYKGKYFMLRVCEKNNEVNTYGFETPKKVACKHLYRCCMEHLAFFQMARAQLLSEGAGDNCDNSANPGDRLSSMQHQTRTPNTFIRLPSNRNSRRSLHDRIRYGSKVEEPPQNSAVLYNKREQLSRVSIPQSLAQDDVNNNRMSNNKAPRSPQSSHRGSHSRNQHRGLFGVAPSPRMARSVSRTDLSQTRGPTTAQSLRHRSSSVESQSSNDSRCRRYKSGSRSRRQSDNESELSRGSGKSGHSHNSHRKQRRHRASRKGRGGDAAEENGSIKSRSYSGHQTSRSNSYELVDSELQWREVQRKQSEFKRISSGVQQAAVTKSLQLTSQQQRAPVKVINSQTDTQNRTRKHRRHRSPADSGRGNNVNGGFWNSELAKHLHFDLIDTTGMSEDQLREIPYTIVETAKPGAGKSLKQGVTRY